MSSIDIRSILNHSQQLDRLHRLQQLQPNDHSLMSQLLESMILQ